MRIFFYLILLINFCAGAAEAPRPLLELGIGMGGGLLPDYPGSDQEHYHFAAFPVLFYHGKIFRSDREDGARARVMQKPTFGIDVSGSESFPVAKGENRARDGMKSLGWLAEAGPRVFARLIDREDFKQRVFTLVRPAASIRAGVIYGRGFVTGTGFQFEKKKFLANELGIYSKITAQFASKEYNDYFYAVSPEYATPERAAYGAKAGYLGSWLSTGLSYEFPHVIVSGGVSAISTKGSANAGSSLFRDDLNWSVFLGFVWFFYHSSEPGYF